MLWGRSVPPPRAQKLQAKPFSMKPGSGCCVPLDQGVQALRCAAGMFQTHSQLQSCSHGPFSPPSSQSGVSDVSGVLYLGHPVLLLHLPLCPCASGPVATNKELWHQLGPCDCHRGQHQLLVMCFPCEWGEEGSSVSTGGSARTGWGCGCSAGNFTELQVLDPVLSPDWFRGTGRAPSSCRFLSFPS